MYKLECQVCGFEQYSASFEPDDACARCKVPGMLRIAEESVKEEEGDGKDKSTSAI